VWRIEKVRSHVELDSRLQRDVNKECGYKTNEFVVCDRKELDGMPLDVVRSGPPPQPCPLRRQLALEVITRKIYIPKACHDSQSARKRADETVPREDQFTKPRKAGDLVGNSAGNQVVL
jgi:hypothetical protein